MEIKLGKNVLDSFCYDADFILSLHPFFFWGGGDCLVLI